MKDEIVKLQQLGKSKTIYKDFTKMNLVSLALKIKLLGDDKVGVPVESIDVNDLADIEPLTSNAPVICKLLVVALNEPVVTKIPPTLPVEAKPNAVICAEDDIDPSGDPVI